MEQPFGEQPGMQQRKPMQPAMVPIMEQPTMQRLTMVQPVINAHPTMQQLTPEQPAMAQPAMEQPTMLQLTPEPTMVQPAMAQPFMEHPPVQQPTPPEQPALEQPMNAHFHMQLAPLDHNEVIRLHNSFQEGLATDALTPEQELNMRAAFARAFSNMYAELRRPEHLDLATRHEEVLLERTPADSPSRPERLDRLAYLRVAKFDASGAAQALDQAIDLGRQAWLAALGLGLSSSRPVLYSSIVNNLGYALSCRYHAAPTDADLTESVTLGREAVGRAAAGGSAESYAMALTNLSFRITMRFRQSRAREDYEEAATLVEEQLELLDAGVPHRAAALAQLSELAYMRFVDVQREMRSSGVLTGAGAGAGSDDFRDLQLLDTAIARCREALDEAPSSGGSGDGDDQRRSDSLRKLADMYTERFGRTADAGDAHSALQYSLARVHAAQDEAASAMYGPSVWHHLACAVRFARATSAPSAIAGQAAACAALVARLPDDYVHREACVWMLGDLMGRTYDVTGKMADLVQFVWHSRSIARARNGYGSRKRRVTADRVAIHKVDEVLRDLLLVEGAAARSAVRHLAYQQLPGWFRKACARSGMPNAVFALWDTHGRRLCTYGQVASGRIQGEAPSEIEAAVVEGGGDAYVAEGEEEEDNLEGQHRRMPEGYSPGLGLRILGRDPSNRRDVFAPPPLPSLPPSPGQDNTLCNNNNTTTNNTSNHDAAGLLSFRREVEAERDARNAEAAAGLHPNPRLCRLCRRLKMLRPRPPNKGGFTWSGGLAPVSLGSFSNLVARQPCWICEAILSLASEETGEGGLRLHPRLTDDVDAQFIVQAATLHNGQRVLMVDYGARQLGALRVVDETDHRCHGLRQRHDVGNGPEDVRKALAGEDDALWGLDKQTLQPELLKTWINSCMYKHSKLCNPEWTSGRLAQPVTIFVVDVHRHQIVQLSTSQSYYALSYVRGDDADSSSNSNNDDGHAGLTVRANAHGRFERYGLPIHSLPATIRDAIRLVRRLGGRYVWIDALCITHDDEQSVKYITDRIDVVFAHAMATIVALDGEDADAGLPGFVSGSRPPQMMRRFAVSDHAADLRLNPASTSVETIYVAATQKPLGLAAASSPWAARASTLQEHVFSRRCLYMTRTGVYFRCRRGVEDETGDEVGEFSEAVADEVLGSPLMALADVETPLSAGGHRQALAAYKWAVEAYTARQLAREADVLSGASGISNFFGDYTRSTMVCGMPMRFIGLALLWTPAAEAVTPRTEPATGALVFLDTKKRGQAAPSPPALCPTWSWASVVGAVEYRILGDGGRRDGDEDGGMGAPLPTELIDVFYLYNRDALLSVHRRDEQRQGCEFSSERLDVVSPNAASVFVSVHVGANVLQFAAKSVPAALFTVAEEAELVRRQDGVRGGGGSGDNARVYRLFDGDQAHCGLVYGMGQSDGEARDWAASWMLAIARHPETEVAYRGLGRADEDGGDAMLVDATGDEMDLDEGGGGHENDDDEIPLFDDTVWPATGPGSGMIDLLVVSGPDPTGVSRRVGVAKIHEAAWEAAIPGMIQVRLG